MARFGDEDVFIVERFDRTGMDGGTWIARLPQEDFCQAIGVPPRSKYEAAGGPGMAKCLQSLAGSADPQQDTLAVQLTQLAFFLSLWPYFGASPNRFSRRQAGLAMALRAKKAHDKLETIQPRHWHQLAMRHRGLAVWDAMQALVERVGPALAAVESKLPAGFPAHTWEAIAIGMRAEAKRFVEGAART